MDRLRTTHNSTNVSWAPAVCKKYAKHYREYRTLFLPSSNSQCREGAKLQIQWRADCHLVLKLRYKVQSKLRDSFYLGDGVVVESLYGENGIWSVLWKTLSEPSGCYLPVIPEGSPTKTFSVLAILGYPQSVNPSHTFSFPEYWRLLSSPPNILLSQYVLFHPITT